ncbi:hypothetical protein [Desulfohalovibrio reitneri]|uniref:hypothetical protein n=1 Tax=Desulfohalovibrio reitneri TaxID=1307759 RepID=UPI00110F544F|nr:hypothetical protein [Desulfohalovibrio reitneri]
MLLGEKCPAPLVLAGLLPALTARVPAVVCLYVGEGFPEPVLLTALELAGQEWLAPLQPGSAESVLSRLSALGGGAVVGLGVDPSFLSGAPGLNLWHDAANHAIGVFPGTGESPDLDLLSILHGPGRLEIWNVDSPPKGSRPRRGGIEDFLAQDYQAAFPPRAHREQALAAFPLTLCGGGEAHWRIPGLGRRFYEKLQFGLDCGD